MYEFLSHLLSDHTSDSPFACFDAFHLSVLFITAAALVFLISYIKKQNKPMQHQTLNLLISSAFALYMLDFFLMPFAYGVIDVEKLPFHICTAMCVMCFLSRHHSKLSKYKFQFALFGFISNLVYLIYPAGIMWYRISFFSYRVIQTLLFHALMTCSCLCTLLFDEIDINSNLWKKELLVICFMSVWACLGSTLYAGYPQTLNWFFVKQDPFYLIPASIAPFIMPIINPLLFFIIGRTVMQMIRELLSNKLPSFLPHSPPLNDI